MGPFGGSLLDQFEGFSSNCTCPETSRNIVFSGFRCFHIGKRSSGGAVILTLEFVAYSALFSPGLRELLGYSSEPLSDLFYTIKLGKTENGCPTGKATVCTRVRRRSRFSRLQTLRNLSRPVKHSFKTTKIRKGLISLRSVAILQNLQDISENCVFLVRKVTIPDRCGSWLQMRQFRTTLEFPMIFDDSE